MEPNLPFKERWVSENQSIRRFSPDVADEELKWHFDDEDRIIECSSETDWKFQFDNELPIKIKGTIKIPKGVWHRLIKGSNDLDLLITRAYT
jgi:hypothetical protein